MPRPKTTVNDILTLNIEIERPESVSQFELEQAVHDWLDTWGKDASLLPLEHYLRDHLGWADIVVCSVDLDAVQEAGQRIVP